MKKILTLSILVLLTYLSQGQVFKNLIKKASSKDSSSRGLNNILNSGGLSSADISAGLREALQVGAERSTSKLSATDGFFTNAVLKILMPEEAKNVESKLRAIGLGSQVDNAILSMNRAAEEASKNALPIFVNAIKGISIQDAAGILRGNDSAATTYLRSNTTGELSNAFRPVVENALATTNATKYWNTLFTSYNKFSLKKINPDLTAYVTERALSGIFFQIGKEEREIRKDPVARSSDILKKVFAAK